MIFGSVCSGIEAASVAWHPLGWRAAFVSEINSFARSVLQHRFPEVPLHGDFTTIEAGQYEPIDVLVGGTPCQSFSLAGLRGGLDDHRGNLSLEFCRLAERLRPRWVVWENVPGVLSLDNGRAFASILGGLVECGYGVSYRVLDAQYVRVDEYARAVPQRRRRVFVVGYLGDWRPSAAVLLEPEGMRWDPAPRRKAGQGHPRAAALGFGGRQSGASDAATALTAHGHRLDWEVETFIAEPIAFSCNDYGNDAVKGGSPTLRSVVTPAIAFNARQDPVYLTECSGLLDTDGGAQAAIGNWRVRRLTPRECERLQGFPDDWTLVLYRRRPAADGPRYRAVGNSMAVNVMRWIGTRIDLCERALVKRSLTTCPPATANPWWSGSKG